jgi:hypothetical protein
MKQVIDRIPMYVANLDPIFWDVPFPVPLSAPFVAEIEPFSHPMGLYEAIKLIEDVQAATTMHDYQKLGLNTQYPRIGPGKVNRTRSLFGIDAHDTFFSVDLTIQGVCLGRNDRVILVPSDLPCPPLNYHKTPQTQSCVLGWVLQDIY